MYNKADIIGLLLEKGMLSPEAMEKAREESRRTGLSVEKSLEKLGLISEEDIVKFRADVLGVPYIDLSDYLVDTELIKLVPENTVRRYKAVPLFKIGDTVTVGMVDPQDIAALDYVRNITKATIVDPAMVSEKGIQAVLDSYYGALGSMEEIARSIDEEKIDRAQSKGLAQVAEEPPIVRLVNVMVMQAAKERASDIHLEPEEEEVRVRYRVDGVLNESGILPKKLQSAVISRIKVLSHMDIAETRKPQDGRIRLKMENRDLDIRVSTFPTVYGENVVMRLLDKNSVLLGLKELGFMASDLKEFGRLIQRPNGIILVTGPTGSGKTTTLYAALTTISSVEKNIITIEDPVEYELSLIRQTQVNIKAGIAFANGLRNILRQDPDVIMVGEIRDKETADIAIQAALTGHLVFSTLHTNDATSAVTRLIDMGVEPFLISSSLIGVIAQRLVRTICERCRERYVPDKETLEYLALDGKTEFFRGKGCPKCKGTGLRGRTGIFELFLINEEIRKMIDARSSADEIKKKAIALGMRTLRDDGIIKAKEGLITIEEVLRLTEAED